MDEIEDGFSVFWWRGQKRYRCNHAWQDGSACAFDSYELDVVKRHSAEPHNSAQGAKAASVKRGSVSPIVGSRGEQIISDGPGEFAGARFRDEHEE